MEAFHSFLLFLSIRNSLPKGAGRWMATLIATVGWFLGSYRIVVTAQTSALIALGSLQVYCQNWHFI
jgi:hypothetical protein